jgi:hypothetical protein
MSTLTNVYVLRLEGGKYYVGKSEDVLKRYKAHQNGLGSLWTRKYSPICILRVHPKVSPFEEDKITKELMSEFGIDQVRGGSYSSLDLDREQYRTLEREIRGAKDLCNRCGKAGHFANRCEEEKEVVVVEEEDDDDDEDNNDDDDDEEDDTNEDDDDEDEEDNDDDVVEEWLCDFCDRNFTTQYGCMVHEKSCKVTAQPNHAQTSPGVCYRCGRKGHYSPDCYASRHINGYVLNK